VFARKPQVKEIAMKNPAGIESVRHRQTLAKLFGCLLALAAMRPVAEAATITVTDMGDTVAVDGLVTLREAITSANNNANVNADVVAVGPYGTDTINFNIAGAGVHTIAPMAALPTCNESVTGRRRGSLALFPVVLGQPQASPPFAAPIVGATL
jgi:hypothetical protein